MFDLKKLFFSGGGAAAVSPEAHDALAAWRAVPTPALDDVHFHVRYVVVDISVRGQGTPDEGLAGISAVGVRQSAILPDDVFSVDFTASTDPAAVNRDLLAFLHYTAKAPLIGYHVHWVGGLLQRAMKHRFDLAFAPAWIDLAWLLPSMFEDHSHTVMPLDGWIEALGLDGGTGRRDSMHNALILARIFQMLLIRAGMKGIGTAAQLVEEYRASSFLRRNH